MGVHKLWNILRDTKESKNLENLKGRKIAVDLATWICEAENVKGMSQNVKPYLR